MPALASNHIHLLGLQSLAFIFFLIAKIKIKQEKEYHPPQSTTEQSLWLSHSQCYMGWDE